MRAPSGQVSDVLKIAVLRANGLGDFLFILPALEALRAAYPQAEIVLLANAWHASFLAGRPGPIDRVVVVPPSRGVSREPDFAEDSAELASLLTKREIARSVRHEWRLAESWPTLVVLVMLLGCEWGLRKWAGLP